MMKIQIQKREDTENEWDVKRKILEGKKIQITKRKKGKSKIEDHTIIVAPPTPVY